MPPVENYLISGVCRLRGLLISLFEQVHAGLVRGDSALPSRVQMPEMDASSTPRVVVEGIAPGRLDLQLRRS